MTAATCTGVIAECKGREKSLAEGRRVRTRGPQKKTPPQTNIVDPEGGVVNRIRKKRKKEKSKGSGATEEVRIPEQTKRIALRK